MAFALPVLMVMASLSVDIGYWRYQQRLQQTAADSAALAGAIAMANSASPSSIAAAAQSDAATNGFSASTVTVNTPPLSGAYAGTPGAVEVIVAKQQPAHFSALLGQSSTVSARAVATLSSADRNCVYALDSTSDGAITLNGATVSMPNCGMISDGGLLFSDGSVNAASIGYAGSSPTINGTSFSESSPRQAVAAADPCPTISGCTYLTSTPPTSGTCAAQTTFNGPGTITLAPGNYCAQVAVSGGGSVVFSPGVYTFENGFVNSDETSMSGTGVTFYVHAGQFYVYGSPAVNLSAPTSGPTAGVVYYQAASDDEAFTINSSSQTGGGWAGMIYAPSSSVVVDGPLSNWLLLVGDDVTLDGTSSVNVPNATFPGIVGHAVLAE